MAAKTYIPIRDWNEDDRPREKMLKLGRQALSDSELLAIILGSGSRDKSAIDLAKEILASCDDNLDELGKISIRELMLFKGVGTAKAVNIAAVLELGRRRQATNPVTKPKISSSQDAFRILHPILADLPYEEFWILVLNRAHRVIKKEKISSGGVNTTLADSRLVFRSAIQLLASSLIIAHNHPSGSLDPSDADISLTKKLVTAGKYLDIKVLDHIILSNNSYVSFADKNWL